MIEYRRSMSYAHITRIYT